MRRPLASVAATVVFAAAGLVGMVVGGQAADAAGSGRRSIERIVTLGDSYSSGIGSHRHVSDYDDRRCGRELDSTPGALLAEQVGAAASMVACAGATIADIPAQLADARIEGDGDGTLLTLTIGGNDVRSFHGDDRPDVLIECITDFSCDDTDRNGIANGEAITADLTELYLAIGEQFPDVTVRVLGYPRLMQTDGWWCDGVTGINQHEADWIDGQVDALNAHIAVAALYAAQETGADIRFVSVVDAFDNHGACRFWQRDRYVNDFLADGFGISNSAFHPSKLGYRAYFEALSASVDRSPSK